MDKTAFTLRKMRETDLPTCLEFTQQVKWPHRMSDWQLHFAQGIGSIIEDADGAIVGCILWWDYGPQYGSVGLVVVPEHMQGNGLGRKLMDEVMRQTGARDLQLVATAEGKRLYQQCGFIEQGSIYQVQGELSEAVHPVSAEGVDIKPLNGDSLEAVLALDASAYQCSRRALLTALHECGQGVVAYANGEAVGYAIIRDSGRGQTIGPVVAADDRIAQALVSELLGLVRGFLRFDLTDEAVTLKPWLESLGLTAAGQPTLMVKGEFLPASGEKARIYSLASQAFG